MRVIEPERTVIKQETPCAWCEKEDPDHPPADAVAVVDGIPLCDFCRKLHAGDPEATGIE